MVVVLINDIDQTQSFVVTILKDAGLVIQDAGLDFVE